MLLMIRLILEIAYSGLELLKLILELLPIIPLG
ncbi:hypothetical protein C4K39_1556 [Pseudomonas sessilinigenes]|nr:hypothetical protein C4K39_1556 [Pseudomonas sessilinigenes]